MADPKVRFKRSSVPGKIPNETQVPLGEIALNTYDGKLFTSKNVGIGTTVFVVNPWSVGAGTDVYDTYFTVGNVGIGSTLPTSKLDVIGNAKVSGIVTATGGFNLGISSAGVPITTGPVTTLNFTGVGNTFSINGTTIDISIAGGGGGGGASVSIGDTAPSTPSAGDLWYSSTLARIFIYYNDGSSSQWVDAAPFNYPVGDNPAKSETSFTATAGQTSFTLSYKVGFVEVYLNGIRLSSSEYTATSGSSIVLTEAASEGDIIDVVEISTGEGPQGPAGPVDSTSVSIKTTGSTQHYPVFVTGTGSTSPYISTTSNHFGFVPESGTLLTNQVNVSGVSTFGSSTSAGTVKVGVGTTALIVEGNARITGILTIGTSSITFDGSNNQVNVGTGVTLHHSNGVQVGQNTLHSTGFTVNNINVTGNVSIAGTLTYEDVTNVDSVGLITARNGIQVTGGSVVVGSAVTLSSGGINVAGVITARNGIQVTGGSVVVGSAVTVNSTGINVAGVITATSFVGNGSGLTGAGSTVADITTNAIYYPLFTQTTSGTVTASGVSTSRLTYNPSTGILSSTQINDAGGNVRALANNPKSGSYTLAIGDVGELINITTGGVTIPPSIFSAGDSVTIYNNSGSSQTITQGVGVTLRLAGTTSTGNRTLDQRGITTVMCVASNEFVISGAGLS
jgi:hypothetical protein